MENTLFVNKSLYLCLTSVYKVAQTSTRCDLAAEVECTFEKTPIENVDALCQTDKQVSEIFKGECYAMVDMTLNDL